MYTNFIHRIKQISAGRAMFIVLLLFTGSVLISMMNVQSKPEPYILNYPPGFGNRFTIPEDNPLTKEGVYLGRLLFYEKKLSGNNTLSCASCHQQKLAFTDGKMFSEGIDKSLTKRNSMSLSNLLWVRNFFWDGRSPTLEEQTLVPLTDPHEMGQSMEGAAAKIQKTTGYPALFEKAFGTKTISGELIVKAIVQFERTLISADSRYDRYLVGNYSPTSEELQGMKLFTTGPSPEKKIRGANCSHCHGMPKTFLELFHNNGLDSLPKDRGREEITLQSTDRGRFRVPTLRNIALTAPYMHDGRFQNLGEVLSHYNEHVKQSETLSPFVSEISNEVNGKTLLLTTQEKKSIISFLSMLTDSTFITNPEFSDPHSLKELN